MVTMPVIMLKFCTLLIILMISAVIESLHLCHIEKGDDLGLLVKALVPFEPFDLLERSIGIPIPINAILWSELINYMEGYNATHGILALGIGMLLNHDHQFSANVRKVPLYETGLRSFREPFQSSIDFLHEITSYLEIGDQLTVDYGDDWFAQRNMTHVPINESLVESVYLHNCPSSYTHLTRAGTIVATTFIPQGTVIEVSRAILVPITKGVTSSGPLEEILWWPNTADTSIHISEPSDMFIDSYPTSPSYIHPYSESIEYAMLLSGHSSLFKAPLCSTLNVDQNLEPNVDYDWFKCDTVRCDNLMLIKFTTLRDITEGEDMVLSNLCHSDGAYSYRKKVLKESIKSCLVNKKEDTA